MASTTHTVEGMDGDRRVVVRYSVPCEQVLELVHGLRQDHGPKTRFLVDGHDISQQAQMASKPSAPVERLDLGNNADLATANLASHMLWESLERAAAIQAIMVDRMVGQSIEMTRRFTEQMDELRARYGAAMAKIDGVAFEQKMFEQERAYRHIALQHRQLADDERRAASRGDIGGLVEQLVGGAVRIIHALGEDPIQRPGESTRAENGTDGSHRQGE